MLSKNRYDFIVSHCEGMALDAIWLYALRDRDTFHERKALFLWLLQRMIEDKKIVAAKNGILLDGSASEIAKRFDLAFPSNEDGLDNGVWFFLPDCPAGIGWVGPGDFIDWV
jgi:hypothetical protein